MLGGARQLVVVGAGPLAGAALLALAGGEVGDLVLVDGGDVGAAEAARHPLLRAQDVAASRAACARRRLTELHPSLQVEAHAELPPLTDAAAVLACPVDAALALAAGDAALEAGVPLVHAAWHGGAGHLLTVQPGLSPCLRCLFEGVIPAPPASPDALAFTLAWALGALAAAEVHRVLAGDGGFYAGRLLALDVTGGSRTVGVRRRPGCRCRAAAPRDPPLPPPERT